MDGGYVCTTQECSPLSTISEVAHFPWGQLHNVLLEFLKPSILLYNSSNFRSMQFESGVVIWEMAAGSENGILL